MFILHCKGGTDLQNKVIAIDGPAGAGKSTIAKMIAKELGYTYIDSGAMYRAITLMVVRYNMPISDTDRISSVANELLIDFDEGEILVDGNNVEGKIRCKEVNDLVSHVAAMTEVRRILVEKQRSISKNKNVVMDGRDVGTVIFPNAFKKFYITANVEERAKRRCKELFANGIEVKLEDIRSQIESRDLIDSTRADSPLKVSEDAIYIDTTSKSIEWVVKDIINHIV